MKKVKRFDPTETDQYGYKQLGCMEEDPEYGDYVSYDDYKDLEDKYKSILRRYSIKFMDVMAEKLIELD